MFDYPWLWWENTNGRKNGEKSNWAYCSLLTKGSFYYLVHWGLPNKNKSFWTLLNVFHTPQISWSLLLARSKDRLVQDPLDQHVLSSWDSCNLALSWRGKGGWWQCLWVYGLLIMECYGGLLSVYIYICIICHHMWERMGARKNARYILEGAMLAQ